MKNNKVFLGLAIFFLVVWALTMLVLRGTITYALSGSRPIQLTQDSTLASNADRFVAIMGTPNRDLAIVYQRYGVSSYWYPLIDYDNRLIVKADTPLPRSPGSSPLVFRGRLRHMHKVAFSSYVIDRFRTIKGLEIAPDTYVISEGESPQTFWPMMPIFFFLTITWFALLIITIIALWSRHTPSVP